MIQNLFDHRRVLHGKQLRSHMKMERSKANDKFTCYLMAAVLFSNAFIFPALVIYLGNLDHFAISLFDALKFSVIVFASSLLLIIALLQFCRPHYQKTIGLFLATLSLLFWMQGNILIWDYRVLDASAIKWDEHQFRQLADASAWLFLTGIVFLLIRARKSELIIQGAILIFLIQLASTFLIMFELSQQLWQKQARNSGESIQRIVKFSKDKNILHIVVDAFQADVFEELVRSSEEKDYYNKSFEGFIFYRETLGMFVRTKFSVPAFLSGKIYDNKTKNDYIKNVLKGKTIISVAKDNGFEIDIVADGEYQIGHYANLPHNNIFDLNNLPIFRKELKDSALLLDLALFRIVPGTSKKYIYNEQKWTVSRILNWETQPLMFEYFTNAIFLDQFVSTMKVEREKPVYKYIHLFSTHGPKVVNKDCSYAGGPYQHNRQSLTFTAKCTLDSLAKLFTKMKDLGIYDESLILVHADHGAWVKNYRQPAGVSTPYYKLLSENFITTLPPGTRAAASPLLAIKIPKAKGEITTTNKLASILDIPDTIGDIMGWGTGFNHLSLLRLQENEKRKRYFRYYNREKNSEENDFTGRIVEFSIEGSHYESEWKFERIMLPDETIDDPMNE